MERGINGMAEGNGYGNYAGEPWVLAGIAGESYGLPVSAVSEMIRFTHVTRVPNMPPHVRGVINLRGKVMPLIDCSQLLMLQSDRMILESLLDNIDGYKKQHVKWIDDIADAVNSGQIIHVEDVLTDDCAFGKWLDSYETENYLIKSLLQGLVLPHREIHDMAGYAVILMESSRFEDAAEAISQIRSTSVAKFIQLCDRMTLELEENLKEIAIIVNQNGAHMALAVDEVKSVEMLDGNSFEDAPLKEFSFDNGIISGIAKRNDGKEIVKLIDAARLSG